MADTDSIFYKIGLKAKDSLGTAVTDLKEADNTWTGTNDFEKAVTVAYAVGTALDIKGTASTSDKLTAESLTSTGDTNAKGGITVTGNATISKDLTVNGNLTISGTESVIDSDNLDITDNIFALSKGASVGDYAKDSGLYFERGSGKSASAFVFDESEESFVVGTLEGSGTPTESLGTDVVSATFTTNASNQVTAIVVDGTEVKTYFAVGIDYINTSTGLGGLKFTTDYKLHPTQGTNEINAVFSNGEIVKLLGSGNVTLVTYDFSNVIAPSGSNADIANTTPAPLTVGSLKLSSQGAPATSDGTITFTANGEGLVTAIVINGTSYPNLTDINGATTTSPGLGLSFLNAADAYGNTANWGQGHQINTVFTNGELTKITDTTGGNTPVTTNYNYLSPAVSQELGNLVDFDAGYAA